MSSTPALTAEDWFSGYNADPVMISMQTGCEILNEHRDENVIVYKKILIYLHFNISLIVVSLIVGLGKSDKPVVCQFIS